VRVSLLALTVLSLCTAPAMAYEHMVCKFSDGNLAFEASAVLVRGRGERFEGFIGRLEIRSQEVPAEIRSLELSTEHLTQHWLYGGDLKLRVYQERPASGLMGHVELIVQAKLVERRRSPRHEWHYRGDYVLDAHPMLIEGASEVTDLIASGTAECTFY
jgi:hypothetical protein